MCKLIVTVDSVREILILVVLWEIRSYRWGEIVKRIGVIEE